VLQGGIMQLFTSSSGLETFKKLYNNLILHYIYVFSELFSMVQTVESFKKGV